MNKPINAKDAESIRRLLESIGRIKNADPSGNALERFTYTAEGFAIGTEMAVNRLHERH